MAIGDVYRLTVQWSSGGIFAGQNVFHYRQESEIEASSPAIDLANMGLDVVVANMANIISSSFQSVQLSVRGVTEPTLGTDLSYAAVPGLLVAGDTYDTRLGALINWYTGLIGRSYRGRTFVLAPTEGVVSNLGAFTSAFLTQVAGVAESIIAPASVPGEYGEWQLGILSTVVDGEERPTPLFTPVLNGVPNPRPGIISKRRRV
jgi:hypothetical protein